MASASWALQSAIFARLTADAVLTALLGGERMYDDVPVRAEFPYLTFGQSSDRDWSTGTDAGREHVPESKRARLEVARFFPTTSHHCATNRESRSIWEPRADEEWGSNRESRAIRGSTGASRATRSPIRRGIRDWQPNESIICGFKTGPSPAHRCVQPPPNPRRYDHQPPRSFSGPDPPPLCRG